MKLPGRPPRYARRFTKRCAYPPCGKEFLGTARARYCSTNCRVKAFRVRHFGSPGAYGAAPKD